MTRRFRLDGFVVVEADCLSRAFLALARQFVGLADGEDRGLAAAGSDFDVTPAPGEDWRANETYECRIPEAVTPPLVMTPPLADRIAPDIGASWIERAIGIGERDSFLVCLPPTRVLHVGAAWAEALRWRPSRKEAAAAND